MRQDQVGAALQEVPHAAGVPHRQQGHRERQHRGQHPGRRAVPGGVRGRVEQGHVAPPDRAGGSPAVIQYTRRRDRDAEASSDQRGEQREHRPAQPAQPLRRGDPLGHRAGPGDPAAAAAERALAGQHQQAEQDQHQGQRAGGGEAVPVELGEDLGRERLVAEDLERAELGQQDQRDQQAAAEDGALGLAERDPGEGADAADARGCGPPPPGRGRRRAGWPPPAGRPAGTRPGSSR